MILRYETWQKIREGFTEQEKETIRGAIDGETICPRGWTIDTEKLPANLLERLKK